MNKTPETYVDGYGNKNWIFEYGIAICRERLEDIEGRTIVNPGDIVKYYVWFDKYKDKVRCMIQAKDGNNWNGKKLSMDEEHFLSFFRVFAYNQKRI
jgi:hypothetical protein